MPLANPHGFKVFPVRAAITGDEGSGKRPLIKDNLNAATTDAEQLKKWEAQFPGCNWGVPGGSRNGVFMLDCDHRHGGQVTLAKLEAEHGPLPETYMVATGNGNHRYFLQPDFPVKSLAESFGEQYPGLDTRGEGGYVVAPGSRHFTGAAYTIVVERAPLAAPDWLLQLLKTGRAAAKSPAVSSSTIPSGQRNSRLASLAGSMRRSGFDAAAIEAALLAQNKRCDPPLADGEVRTIAASVARYDPSRPAIDPDRWRDECKSIGQLSLIPPRFLLAGLIPRGALTMIPAPSYNCKTWAALQIARAISVGEDLWEFQGPRDVEGQVAEPVPVIYHVPELSESYVRERAVKLGIEDSESFLVRPMELGLWTLDDPRMIRSGRGRLVVLDTTGYFNPADNTHDYQQAVAFAKLVYNLLNEGAAAVVGLYHPPKYASQSANGKLAPEPKWTLENSILGSAGYGGILRSCLRLKNLRSDLNDADPWVYVQGLKNPGLKPFQLEGIPLRLKVRPGESPYLHDLLRQEDERDAFIRECVRNQMGVNATERESRKKFPSRSYSHGKICDLHRKFKDEIAAEADDDPQTSFDGLGGAR